MFVTQTITVTENSAREPFVIQAVPHILINVQFYKPNGEISAGHSPNMTGRMDGQSVWIREGNKKSEGAYTLMAPHGVENVRLDFITNEHSALMVQFEGGKPSPRTHYTFPKLDDDLDNIRVIRYPASILKVRAVDEAGAELKDPNVFATYAAEDNATDDMMMMTQIGYHREEGALRFSSIVPNTEFVILVHHSDYEKERVKLTLSEGERRTVTVTLKRKATDSQSLMYATGLSSAHRC
jgi:hypothetical protein